MCVSCFTTVDALATNSVIVAAAATNGWERVKDRRTGRSRLDRRQQTWEENAAFLRSLGLDPLATLGAPPMLPADAPASERTA